MNTIVGTVALAILGVGAVTAGTWLIQDAAQKLLTRWRARRAQKEV